MPRLLTIHEKLRGLRKYLDSSKIPGDVRNKLWDELHRCIEALDRDEFRQRQNHKIRRGQLPDGITPCGYCFDNLAAEYDHLIPKSYGGRNNEANLFPACRRCNSLLSNRIFDSIEEKKAEIRKLIWKD